MRSALALGVLATGLAVSSAQAQPYPPPPYQPYPYGAQGYYPPARPLPPAAIPDDDDDDIPPHQRAAPGNYPPPPGGYRGPFACRAAGSARPLPPPAYARPPAVVYGAPNDGYAPRRPMADAARSAMASPKSYGAAPQAPAALSTQPYPPQPYPPQYGAAPNQAEPRADAARPRRASAARRHRHGAAEHGRDAAARGSARDRQVRACRRSSSASS